MLKDPCKLEGLLKEALDKARERRERQEAAATLDERLVLNAAAQEEARRLKRAEGESFQAEVLRQVGGQGGGAGWQRPGLESGTGATTARAMAQPRGRLLAGH